MFRLTSLTPYDGPIETVKLNFHPLKRINICAPITDIEGKKWDCHGVWGKHLLLRPYVDDYFTSTLPSDFYEGIQSAHWVPYLYEVME